MKTNRTKWTNFTTCLAVLFLVLVVPTALLLNWLSEGPLAKAQHVLKRPINLSFWVWNRSSPLSLGERDGLIANHSLQLYWHAGVLTLNSGHWVWKSRNRIDWAKIESDPQIEIVPTLRLEPPPSQDFTPQSNSELIQELSELETASHASMLQIDYESTDRQMAAYEAFLGQLKAQTPGYKLSISALGHWHRFANEFSGLTDEMVPMFYDLLPGRESLHEGKLPNLADADAGAAFQHWSTCAISWKTGLPNFSRISVISKAGESRGNIRQWHWDDVWFAPQLVPLGPTESGQTRFRVSEDCVIADTPLLKDETVVARYPDLRSLADLVAQANGAGAAGIVWFRLADGTDMSGYETPGLAQICQPGNAATSPSTFSLKWDETRLVLTSGSSQDFMPQVAPDLTRGYAIAMENPQGSWREALPGDFAKVTVDAQGEHEVTELGLGVTRLYFWFSALHPGQTLSTGLVQRDSNGPIRWQIVNLDSPEEWHTL